MDGFSGWTVRATGIDHVAVVVEDADLDALAVSGGFDVISGPMDLWEARGQGRGMHVREPDGNLVELRAYSPAKFDVTATTSTGVAEREDLVGVDARRAGVEVVEPLGEGRTLERDVVVEHRLAKFGADRVLEVEKLGPAVNRDGKLDAG